MFAHRITLFELYGFRVQIDASWLLLAVLIVWSLAAGYFPEVAPGLSTLAYWSMAVIGLIGLAASIVVHEFAHSIVARGYDMPIKGITLFAFGGVAEMNEEPSSAWGELWMALAGPATSVVIAGLFYVVANGLAATIGEGHPLTVVAGYLAFINIVLVVFNMIPAYPLDGGRVLRAGLWLWTRDIVRATRIAAGAGSLMAFLLMALGVFAFLTGSPIMGMWWLLIGMFIRAAAVQGYREQIAKAALSSEPVSRFMRRDPVAVMPDLPLDRLIEDYFYHHYFKSFPVAVDGRLVGCVSIERVKALDPEHRAVSTVGAIMEQCGPDNTVAEDSEAAQALRQMQRTGRSRLFVVRGQRLVGVLSLRDLMNYLSLRMELEGEHAAAPAK